MGQAQTIEIESASVARGSANILRMSLKPRTDKPVVALQWEILTPNSLRIEPTGVVTSGSAEKAGKSVSCAVRPPRESQAYLRMIKESQSK